MFGYDAFLKQYKFANDTINEVKRKNPNWNYDIFNTDGMVTKTEQEKIDTIISSKNIFIPGYCLFTMIQLYTKKLNDSYPYDYEIVNAESLNDTQIEYLHAIIKFWKKGFKPLVND